MYIIHHASGATDYSLVKPAYEENGTFYFSDIGSLLFADLNSVVADYSEMTLTANGVVYPMTLLQKNKITLPKITFDVFEEFVLNSETGDVLTITPRYTQYISGFSPTMINVIAGDNTIQFKQKGSFVITSQDKISGNYSVVVDSTISPRGDYVEVL